MNPVILFENSHVVVIDKPVGIIVHPDDRQDEYTVANWMQETYKVKGIGDAGREGIVHRLDRNTSGVLVLAKDAIAFTLIKRQFREHTVRKVYRAIVEGHIKHDTGMISLPIARAKSDFRKRTVVDMFSQDTRGEERDAITRYKVLARLEPIFEESVIPLSEMTSMAHLRVRMMPHVPCFMLSQSPLIFLRIMREENSKSLVEKCQKT